jgi:hypothetical protein
MPVRPKRVGKPTQKRQEQLIADAVEDAPAKAPRRARPVPESHASAQEVPVKMCRAVSSSPSSSQGEAIVVQERPVELGILKVKCDEAHLVSSQVPFQLIFQKMKKTQIKGRSLMPSIVQRGERSRHGQQT